MKREKDGGVEGVGAVGGRLGLPEGSRGGELDEFGERGENGDKIWRRGEAERLVEGLEQGLTLQGLVFGEPLSGSDALGVEESDAVRLDGVPDC